MLVRRPRVLTAIALGLLIGLAAYLRLVDLAGLPPPLHIDEAAQGVNALEILDGKRPVLGYGWTNHLNTAFLPTGVVLKLFGPTVWNLRITEVGFGIVAVLLTFFLGRSMFSWRVGITAATLLSFNHFALAFSRIGLVNQQSMTVELLAFTLLWHGFSSRRRLPTALGGAMVGVGLYLYFGSWVVPVVLGTFVVWALAVRRREARRAWRLALWGVLGFAVAILPWLAFPVLKPDEFRQRPTEVFILSDLDRYKVGWKTDSAFEVFRLQAYNTVKVFYRGGDTSNQYGYDAPMLTPAARWLFFIGIGVALLSVRRWPYAFLLIWFALTLAIGGILTDTPPFVPRLVGLIPATTLLVALGLVRPIELLGLKRIRWVPRSWVPASTSALARRVMTPAFLVAFAIIALLGFRWHYQAYFIDYPVTPYTIYWPWIEPMNTIGDYLSSREEGTRVYILRTRNVYTAHPIIQFHTYGRDLILEDVQCPDTPCLIPRPADGGPAVYILLPETLNILEQVRQELPGGVARTFTGRVDPNRTVSEMFVAYEVRG
jgi:hypothetical protein